MPLPTISLTQEYDLFVPSSPAKPSRRSRRALEPDYPPKRAAPVGVRWRRGNPQLQRDRIRVAQRLTSGMTGPVAARAEGSDEGAIEVLPAQTPFRALVASQRARAERPAAEQTVRLVKLARLAIENALNDWDMGAAFFVPREHSQDRDPALTIARRVLAAARPASAATAAAVNQ